MAKKRLTLRDKQGNVIDYDISAARVTIDAEGKTLEVKLSELVNAIADAVKSISFNGNTQQEDAAGNVAIEQVQADWNQVVQSHPSFIKGKPNVVTGIKVGESGTTITPTNGVVTIPESGGNVDVDNAMSASSDNPVANRVIKAYVDNLINGLINGAPAALDTLNELSAALGNDSNFAATITQQLALKANDANVVKSISVNGQSPQTPSNGNVNLIIEAGAQGPKGDKGDTVVIGDEEEFLIVNDLVSGGEADALSAEMGRRLAMLSGTYAEAWAHAQAIPFPFMWMWSEVVDGEQINKPIWHIGNNNFVDAAGSPISVVVTASAGDPTISGTEGSTVPKDTVITITPASGCALHYSVDGGSTYKVADRAVNITLSTAGAKTIMAYCSNPNGSTTPVTRHITVQGTAVPTFAAKPNSSTTLTQKTGYIEVSRGGYVRISGTENGTLYYSTDGENYTEVQGNNYYDFQIANSSYEATAFVIYAKNKVGNDFSDPVTGTFKMAALAAPSFSPAAGTLPMGGGTVEITHTDNNVDIYYTTDGSDPTDQSTAYSSAIAITAGVTIKAVAKDTYGYSAVTSGTYEVAVPSIKVVASSATTMNLGDSGLDSIPIAAGTTKITIADINTLAGTSYESFADHAFTSLSFGDVTAITEFDGCGVRVKSLASSFKNATNLVKAVGIKMDGNSSSSEQAFYRCKALQNVQIISGKGYLPRQMFEGVEADVIDISGMTDFNGGGYVRNMLGIVKINLLIVGSGFVFPSSVSMSPFSSAGYTNTYYIKKVRITSSQPPSLEDYDWVGKLLEQYPVTNTYMTNFCIEVPKDSLSNYTAIAKWNNYSSYLTEYTE